MTAALSFSVHDFSAPQILAAEKDFLLVYKPPRMHSAPLAGSAGDTLLGWCAGDFPEAADLPGRKPGEGGLLHRLDYETQGLMLIARTRRGMEALLEQQREGKILKEYSALTAESGAALPGFPSEKPELPRAEIVSAFRPYGPGRKAVRPVPPGVANAKTRGVLYTTEILEVCPVSAETFQHVSFRLRIKKGFRHQIRCHLAWLGHSILNDGLYGGSPDGKGFLALRAFALVFIDPSSGETRRCELPPLVLE